MIQKRIRQRTRGYLLIELMVVMTMTMVILSLSSVWVYKTMLYSSNVAQRDSHARNISRISRQLRTDARDAVSVTANDNLLSIKTSDGMTIEYSIDGSTISRKFVQESGTHQDRFEFATNAKLKWDDSQAPESVALNIVRDHSASSVTKKMKSKRLDAQIRIRAKPEAVQ